VFGNTSTVKPPQSDYGLLIAALARANLGNILGACGASQSVLELATYQCVILP